MTTNLKALISMSLFFISACSEAADRSTKETLINGKQTYVVETDAILSFENHLAVKNNPQSADIDSLKEIAVAASRTGTDTLSPDHLPAKAAKVCKKGYEIISQSDPSGTDPIVFIGSDGIWVSPIFWTIQCTE